jgi:uncharacterized protein YndB with AHSA1/START domain
MRGRSPRNIERFIDAPTRLVWEALTKPEHLKE